MFVPSGLFLVRTCSSVMLNPLSLLRARMGDIRVSIYREQWRFRESRHQFTFHSHGLVICNLRLGQTTLLQFRFSIDIQANFFIQHRRLAEVAKRRYVGQLHPVINDNFSSILRLDFRDRYEGERSGCSSQRDRRVERVDPRMIAAVCSESLGLVQVK